MVLITITDSTTKAFGSNSSQYHWNVQLFFSPEQPFKCELLTKEFEGTTEVLSTAIMSLKINLWIKFSTIFDLIWFQLYIVSTKKTLFAIPVSFWSVRGFFCCASNTFLPQFKTLWVEIDNWIFENSKSIPLAASTLRCDLPCYRREIYVSGHHFWLGSRQII